MKLTKNEKTYKVVIKDKLLYMNEDRYVKFIAMVNNSDPYERLIEAESKMTFTKKDVTESKPINNDEKARLYSDIACTYIADTFIGRYEINGELRPMYLLEKKDRHGEVIESWKAYPKNEDKMYYPNREDDWIIIK